MGCRYTSHSQVCLVSFDSCCLRVADLNICSDAEVRSDVFKSLLLNLVSLTSIYFFDLLLLPLTHEHTHWLSRNVGWFYQILWLFPVVGVSLYLNVSPCT